MELREVSPGVFYLEAPCLAWEHKHVDLLRESARSNPRKRARICLHTGATDVLHEMLICLLAGVYVRPHRHFKPESLHMLEGNARVVCFDDQGVITRVLDFGTGASQVPFVRFSAPVFHTVLVRQDDALFHEVTRGPWRPDETEWAVWAPADEMSAETTRFLDDLMRRADEWGN